MVISKNIKSFLSDSFIYTSFNLINKSIPFFLLPFLVRVLPTEDFGSYSLFLSVEALLIPIVSLNLHSSLSSHFYEKEFFLPNYLSTIVFSLIGFVFLFFIFLLVLPNFSFFGISPLSLKLAIFSASFLGIIGMFSNLFRLQRKPWSHGLFSIFQSVLLFLFLFVSCFIEPSFNMVIYGRILYSFFLFLIFFLIFKYKNILVFVFKYEVFKKSLKFSLPTLIYSISAFIFLSSDKFFINYFLDTNSVAHYSAILQLASIISILGMSINAAWMPWLFENLSKKSYLTDVFIVKISYTLILFFIFSGFLFVLLFPYISKIILPINFQYYNYVSVPIIFGFVFEAIYLIVSPYLFYVGKTKYNAFIGIFVAVINIIFNLFLIPHFGILGAAIATCISWVILSIVFFIFSYKVYPMPWLFFLNK
jgi:O-antigen/teichoic acid export membrane protein